MSARAIEIHLQLKELRNKISSIQIAMSQQIPNGNPWKSLQAELLNTVKDRSNMFQAMTPEERALNARLNEEAARREEEAARRVAAARREEAARRAEAAAASDPELNRFFDQGDSRRR